MSQPDKLHTISSVSSLFGLISEKG